MEQFNVLKHMVQFNKSTFDQGYNAMDILRKQNEKMTNSFLDQAAWMPEEGKKAVSDCMQVYKKVCEDFKKATNQNYENVEKVFSGFSK